MAYPYDNNMPLGTQALNNRPYVFRVWDAVAQHPWGWAAIGARSHARLITQGPYTSGLGARYAKTMEKSLADSTKGGWRTTVGHYGAEFKSRINPYGWYKAGSLTAFDPERKSAFHTLMYKTVEDAEGNKSTELNKAATKVSEILDKGKTGERLRSIGVLDSGGKLSRLGEGDFLGRMSAASTWDRLARKDPERIMSADHSANLRGYLQKANSELADKMFGNAGAGINTGRELTYREGAQLTRMAMIRPVTGGFAGYYEGIRNGVSADGMTLNALDENIASSSERAAAGYARGQVDKQIFNAWRSGGKAGLQEIAGASAEDLAAGGLKSVAGKTVGQLGRRATMAAGGELVGAIAEGGLNPVMDIMAAYSIAKLGMTVIGGAISGAAHFAEGGVKSFMGDINKPVGGMGYRPTLAATTSRARGVMAIQNSQINARSVLGSEAGAIFQHFG